MTEKIIKITTSKAQRMLKSILLFVIAIGLFANLFLGGSVFPKKVKNQCEYSWQTAGKGFVFGQFNIMIDLKNSSGDLEERAYIYIDCKGHSPELSEPPFYDFANITSTCMGVRITSLNKSALDVNNVFAIRPDSVEVKSSQKDDKLVLVWEDASTFEIENKKSFSWTMKSKLSGNTYKGFVACE